MNKTTMMQIRHRIGENGACELLKVNIALGQDTGVIASKRLKVAVIDTTVKPPRYSPYKPEVVCIAKGKALARYELGATVGVVTTAKEGFWRIARPLAGSPLRWPHRSTRYSNESLRHNSKVAGTSVRRLWIPWQREHLSLKHTYHRQAQRMRQGSSQSATPAKQYRADHRPPEKRRSDVSERPQRVYRRKDTYGSVRRGPEPEEGSEEARRAFFGLMKTAASVHDTVTTGKLLHGEEQRVFVDAGYLGVQKRKADKLKAEEIEAYVRAL